MYPANRARECLFDGSRRGGKKCPAQRPKNWTTALLPIRSLTYRTTEGDLFEVSILPLIYSPKSRIYFIHYAALGPDWLSVPFLSRHVWGRAGWHTTAIPVHGAYGGGCVLLLARRARPPVGCFCFLWMFSVLCIWAFSSSGLCTRVLCGELAIQY